MKLKTPIATTLLICFFLLNCKNESKDIALINVQDTELQKSIKRGHAIYADFCTSCHLPSGEGVKNIYPPLANSDYLQKERTASVKGLKYGLKGEIIVNGKTYNNAMAPMGLANDEIADVMNYINHSWGNDYGEIVLEEEVAKIQK